MAKIAIYTRVSSERQVDSDGQSLEVQKERCEQYLLSQGKRKEDFVYYSDEGLSGTNIVGRDDLTRLLDHIKMQAPSDQEYIQGICCYDLSRISRSIKHTVEIFRLLKSKELDFYTRDGAFAGSLDNQNSKVMMAVFGMLNELFIDQLRDKVVPGMRKSAQSGNHQGGPPPLGYYYEFHENDKGQAKRRLKPDPNEVPLVVMIFNLFVAEHYSLFGIAKHLNSQGYRTKQGKEFSTTSVQNIIKNPIYIGKVVWGKKRTKSVDEDTGLRVIERTSPYDLDIGNAKGYHDAIISEEVYFRAMDRMRAREQHRQNYPMADHRRGAGESEYFTSSKRMFSNVLRCPNCGGRMTPSLQPGHVRKDGHKSVDKVYYKCSNRNQAKGECNSYYSAQEDRVFALIRDEFFSEVQDVYQLVSDFLRTKANDRGGEVLSKDEDKISDELARLRASEKSLLRQINNVILGMREFESEPIIAEQTRKNVMELNTRVAQIRDTIIQKEAEARELETKRRELLRTVEAQDRYRSIEDYFWSLKLREQRELIEQVYDEISLNSESSSLHGPKRLTIKYIKRNPRFSPFAILRTLGVSLTDELTDFLITKGKHGVLMFKHYPDIMDYLRDVDGSDSSASDRLGAYIQDMLDKSSLMDEDEQLTGGDGEFAVSLLATIKDTIFALEGDGSVPTNRLDGLKQVAAGLERLSEVRGPKIRS